jgi:alcohol dehydrogenase
VNTNGVHALAYPLGGECHLPHALSIALLLPHVVAFNCSALIPRHAALARALGDHSPEDARAAAALPTRLRDLLDRCALPLGLARQGVARESLTRLAEAGLLVTRLLKNNPRPVARADAIAIYEAAY